MPRDTRQVIIAIHGVGNAEPGALLREIGQGIGVTSGSRCDLVLGDTEYPRLAVDHEKVAEIIEVNWSDVARPSRTTLGVLDYLVKIVAAMLMTARARLRTRAPWVSTVYLGSFEAVLVYCIYAPLLAMVWTLLETQARELLGVAGLVATLALVAVTLYLQRLDSAFRGGWLWAAALAALTVLVATESIAVDTAARVATAAYLLGISFTGFALFAAIVDAALCRRLRFDQRIARMALLYLPYFIVSAIGALMWALSLASAKLLADPRSFDAWQSLYAGILRDYRYNLTLIEWTFAAMVAALGLALLALAGLYAIRAKSAAVQPPEQSAGQFARDGGRNILLLGAIAFASLAVMYLVFSAVEAPPGSTVSALMVYGWSSLRFVPYLPLLIGPLALVAGIVVDILFYIVPARHSDKGLNLSTAAVLRDRLARVIAHVRCESHTPIMIAAHSQGSVIAVDVLAEQATLDDMALITAGSPVRALYARFLDMRPGMGIRCEPLRWVNFWREGDYIGSTQDRSDAVIEVNLGTGGHTRYWQESRLWLRAFRETERP